MLPINHCIRIVLIIYCVTAFHEYHGLDSQHIRDQGCIKASPQKLKLEIITFAITINSL